MENQVTLLTSCGCQFNVACVKPMLYRCDNNKSLPSGKAESWSSITGIKVNSAQYDMDLQTTYRLH